MKRIILISLFFIFNSSVVFAGDNHHKKDYKKRAPHNPLYFKVSGMFATMSDADVSYNGQELGKIKTDSTFGASAEIGANLGHNFFAGLEYSYREFEAEIDEALSMEMQNLMWNVNYEHDLGTSIKPYVVAGLGLAFTDPGENTEFAYQIKVGLGYELTQSVDLFGGYRYLATSDVESELDTDLTMEIDTHNFEAGVKYSF